MDILPCISADHEFIYILRATIADSGIPNKPSHIKNDPLMGSLLVCHEYVEVSAELTCDPAGRYANELRETVCSIYERRSG